MKRFLLVVLVTSLAACATPPEPDWLQDLRAREVEPLPLQRIQSADGFFRARVPGTLDGPIQTEDGAYIFSLDIGTTAPVDCWLYRDGIDFAASLAVLSEGSFATISGHVGEVQVRRVDGVDAGVLGESPFLTLAWVYRLGGDAGPQIGGIKHLVASKDGRGLYCQHNELGYTQSFRRAVNVLLANLQYRHPTALQPHFSEVSTLSVRGNRVGIEYTTLANDEGDTRIDTRTSMLMPVTADTLQASDTFAVEFARSDGSLINQVHVESQNGEIVSNLQLNPVGRGVWSVEGTFQGKPLSTRIEAERQPSSWLGEALALRRTLAAQGPGAEIRSSRWVPSADPTRLLDGRLSIGSQLDAERFAAKLATSGLQADLVVDRAGTVTAGSVDLGVAAMDFERVYVDGAF